MRTRLIVTVLGILLLDCTPKRELSQPLEIMLYGAERKLMEGDPRGAIETYREIIQAADASAAWFGMAGAYIAIADTDSAIISYFEGIRAHDQREKEDPYYWMRMGYWYGRTGDSKRALAAFEKALALAPDEAKAWNNIGVVYHEDGKYDKAIPHFKKAIALDPTDQRFWYNLGLAYHHIGAYDDAIIAYNASLNILEARAKVWNDLGVTYRMKGELEKAMACYDRALVLSPEDPDIWFNKGLLLDRMGKYEEAMFCYMKWAEFAVSWSAYLHAGKKAIDLGKFPLAWSLLDKALYYRPISPEVWSARVYARWKEGGLVRAREEAAASGRYLSEEGARGVRALSGNAISRLTARVRGLRR